MEKKITCINNAQLKIMWHKREQYGKKINYYISSVSISFEPKNDLLKTVFDFTFYHPSASSVAMVPRAT